MPGRYTVLGWPKIAPDIDTGQIRWHIVNFTEKLPKYKTVLAFTNAFAKWQAAFDNIEPRGRVIELHSTSDFHQAHIHIFFLKKGVEKQTFKLDDGSEYTVTNPWPFKGALNVLAHVPYGAHQIHFDESENWSELHNWVAGDVKIRLEEVVLHELGHIFDLGHSQVKEAVMYPTYDGTHMQIHDDDQRGLSKAWNVIKAGLAESLLPKKPGLLDLCPSPGLVEAGMYFYGWLKEVPGPGSHPTLLEIIREMFPSAQDDSKVAWCSIILNAVAKMSGYERTNSGLARSWLDIGTPIEFEDRKMGDILIYWRVKKASPWGHANIYINDYDESRMRGLGGNQQDAMNIRAYSNIRLLGIRRLAKVE